jgi:transposase
MTLACCQPSSKHWDAAMFRLAADLQVYLHREPIDFRCGIDSLAILVEQSMKLDPFARVVFAFCNRRKDRMKLLFFDRSGFVLILKRLESDKFRWPRREVAVLTLSAEQLHWLLDGIDIEAVSRHPARRYHSVGGDPGQLLDTPVLPQSSSR